MIERVFVINRDYGEMEKKMKIFISLLMLVTSFSIWGGSPEISKSCVSGSGKSTYDIELDTGNGNGEIRYRFMGQDIFYSVQISSVTKKAINGVASFKESRSGETKGSPFEFKYGYGENTFYETGMAAKCD